VRVVAAGVHVAVGRREGEAGLLGHVQRVVIGADAEHASRLLSLYEGHDALFSVSVADLRDTHLLKLLDDESLRAGGVEADLRHGVKGPPPLDDPFLHGLRFALYVVHEIISLYRVCSCSYSVVVMLV